MQDLKTSIVQIEAENANKLLLAALDRGVGTMEILDVLEEGLNEIGEKYERGEYFLSELIMGGEIMKSALKVLEPRLKTGGRSSRGKIVLGTMLGDLHDIGKDIIKTLLISAGFDVYDLGIDVPPEKFVEMAREVNADIIGMSALLSVTVPRASDVVKALEKNGMRKKVKVIMGGAAVRKENIEEFGVDAAVNDAIEGVRIIKSWMRCDEA